MDSYNVMFPINYAGLQTIATQLILFSRKFLTACNILSILVLRTVRIVRYKELALERR
jgi:hypothetical protein